jgi:hypothetical protein
MRKIIKPNHGERVKAEIIAVISASIQIHRPRESGVAAVGIAKIREVIKIDKSQRVIQFIDFTTPISRYK